MSRPSSGRHYEFHLYNTVTGEYDDTTVIALPSVTSIISAVYPKEGLLWWYYEQTVQGVEILLNHAWAAGKGSKTFAEACANVDEWLETNNLRPVDIRDEAGTRGTAGHAYLEAMASETAASAATPIETAIVDWWDFHKPSVVASEERLVSLKGRFVGTTDLVWRDREDRLWITDLKTRGAHYTKPRPSDELQVEAYRQAWDEMYPTDLCYGVSVLMAKVDGTFAYAVVEKDLSEVWAHTLSLYEAIEEAK